MKAPLIIIRPDLGKRAYRLKCRFVTEPYPSRERVKQGALKVLEWFIRDMAKEGWEYLSGERIRLNGPFAPVRPMTIHRLRPPGSREMLPGVVQGRRFRADAETIAGNVPPLPECETWEYEVAAVFAHKTILTELPDRHEELEALRR